MCGKFNADSLVTYLAEQKQRWTASGLGLISPDWRHRLRQRLRRLTRPAWLGTLRRTTPLSDHWGFDRGTPIDRYYIECFLKEHREDIRGHVLEVRDSRYSDRYGVSVQRRDVLDVDPTNSNATIVADLTAADAIPSNRFDCFVLTQTLQFIYDTRAAVAQARRILRPGGVLLATVPALSRLDRSSIDYWRFTVASCSSLFADVFGTEQTTIRSYGNILTAIAFLTGMACQELSRSELEAYDKYFPVIIAVRATKACES
jgi:hypothetical protein